MAAHLLLQTPPLSPPPSPPRPPRRSHRTKDSPPLPHPSMASRYFPPLQSLLQRVAALESQLPHLSPSPSPSPPPPPRPSSRSRLRDAAARIIQSRFRLYLVRRSRTLRDLQRLADVKSRSASLKSSLSVLTPSAASRMASDLLLQLDSIQSTDTMIREGKRSVCRELSRVSEYIKATHSRVQQGKAGALISRRNSHSGERRVRFADEEESVKGCKESLEEGNYEEETEEETQQLFGEEEESPMPDGLSAPLPIRMEPRGL